MKWRIQRGKKAPKDDPAAELVRKTLSDNRIKPESEVLSVVLESGRIKGEGTYSILVSYDYSRQNLDAIGITRDEYRPSKGPAGIRYEGIPQKRLEEALTETYGVEFPERGAAR